MSYNYSENKTDLVVNKVSKNIYRGLLEAGRISDDQIYIITDPVLDSSEVFIDGTRSNLSVMHISDSDYHKLVKNDDSISNVLYVVDYDNENFFGERLTNVGDPESSQDAATKNYVDSEISKIDVSGQLSSYPKRDGIEVGYDRTDRKIRLDADGHVSEIDATDFIKDGMLSSVSYDGKTNKLVLSFNTDSGASPISVDLSSLVDVYTAGNGLTVVNNQFRINENIVTTRTVASQISSDLNRKVKNKVTFRYWSET